MRTLAEWTVTEYFGYDWPEQMVWHEVSGLPEGLPLEVVDQANRSRPAQFDARRQAVCYVTDLPARAAMRYVLGPAGNPPEPSLGCCEEGGRLRIDNSRIGIELAWGEAAGSAAGEPPLFGVRGVDGVWFGGSGLRTGSAVVSRRTRFDAKGPVLIEAVQSYVLGDGTTLEIMYAIDAASPVVRVTIRQEGPAGGELVWHLGCKFRPDQAYWRPFHPSEGRAQRPWNPDGFERQSYPMRYPVVPDVVNMRLLYNWPIDGSNLWAGWRLDDRRDLLMIGPIRPSRNHTPPEYLAAELRAGTADGSRFLDYAIPLQNGVKVFALGVLDRDQTDVACEPSVGPANDIDRTYARVNMPGLDDYHRMALDWEGIESLAFPRLWLDPAELPAIHDKAKRWEWFRERFEKHADDRLYNPYLLRTMHLRDGDPPLGSDPAGAFLAGGELRHAQQAKCDLMRKLDAEIDLLLNYGPAVEYAIGIRISRRWRTMVEQFDFVLGSEAFTTDERLDVLRKLAFIAEVMCSADAWPASDAGLHRANPNFHPDVISARGVAAAMLTGHPRKAVWMDEAVAEMEWTLRQSTFASGCFDEAPTYQFCFVSYALQMDAAVARQGCRKLRESAIFTKALDYLASILTPVDPRAGHAMIPTIGHVTSHAHCQSMSAYFAWAALAAARSDPSFSRRMMAAWRRGGGYLLPLHEFWNGMIWALPLCLVDPELPADETGATTSSVVHEGLGPVLRTRHGDGSEGYLLYKLGESRGHYDADEGSLIWYAFGKPILTDYGTQYTPLMDQPWMNNRISVDHKADHRLGGKVLAAALTDGVDYVCGQIPIEGLHPVSEWPLRFTEEHTAAGHPALPDATHHLWRRRVLYLHELEAIVLLDQIDGPLPTDWSIHVLADGARVHGARATLRGQFGLDIAVDFLAPHNPRIEISGYSHLGFDEPGQRHFHWRDIRWTAPPGLTITAMAERTTILRARAESNQPYLAILTAYPNDDPRPTVVRGEREWSATLTSVRGQVEIATEPPFDTWRVRIATPHSRYERILS